MTVQLLIETALANGYEVRISPVIDAAGHWVKVSAWEGGKERVTAMFSTLPRAADACLHDIHSR